MHFPPEYEKDIEKGIEILKAEGCTEIYIFGSLLHPSGMDRNSDIDIAIRGIPKSRFFTVYGKLLSALVHAVDLVSLDYETPFVKILIEKGTLHRVA